ncbi:glucose-6-phosphate dehydrogenase [Microbacterium sp.]|uniref:glucose-6-phosphate dehydrogenase n=1 Tax=Microbacterium sp. TaxID=51671 RepID=UPI0025EB1EF3|nr:glucose-6-phosphate dehydrogenase [Microbacterium sp.]
MKITNSSDWRDGLPFDLPVDAAEAVPGEPTRCATCGADSEPFPREALWAVKHRHPTNPAGFVRFYCADHRPQTQLAPPATPARVRRERASTPRRAAAPTIPERVAALCPDCFVEVPASGVCGMCGQRVA